MLRDGGARVLVTGLSKVGLESAQKEIGMDALVVASDARSLTEIEALASRVLPTGVPTAYYDSAVAFAAAGPPSAAPTRTHKLLRLLR